jgi:UDP-N-acetyl-D-mannosaminuronate dehydrogenase
MHKSGETMKRYLKVLTKYVGGVDEESTKLASTHLRNVGFETKIMQSPLETEIAKLFETTYRAWMIACFQEMHRISRRFMADFPMIVEFIADTHLVRFDRPVMFPDVIGGHCLIPNTELLLKSYESVFLRLILESNKKREEEVEDLVVKGEVEKIKKKVEILEKSLLRGLSKRLSQTRN